MALQRLVIDGYGQIELNQVAWPRDGRVEAQCALDPTDFATIPAENGMLLAVDNVKRVVKLAANANLPLAINYSTEHMYDERTPGLKNFKLTKDDVYPRLGYLSVGDKFTTNCLAYDTADYASEDALKAALDAIATTEVYGTYCNLGAIKLTKTRPTTGPVLRVVKKTTMPDGQLAVKLQVIA